jgi:hypothetical protein
VKRLVTVVIIAILLVWVASIGLHDTHISIADTSIPGNKITSSQTKASNSCAIAITVIAWTTPSGEGGSNEL